MPCALREPYNNPEVAAFNDHFTVNGCFVFQQVQPTGGLITIVEERTSCWNEVQGDSLLNQLRSPIGKCHRQPRKPG